MSGSLEVEIEVIRPANPLAPPPWHSPPGEALLDRLLAMLPEHPIAALRQVEAPPLDLGLVASEEETSPSAPAESASEEPDSPSESRESKPSPAKSRPRTGRLARNVQERLRGLSAAEQQKLARTGEQTERIVLERLYGKAVWEGLLRNPKLTPPEAARIARMGALPVPLIELIVGNRAWLSSPQVRRALLANRRLKKEMVMTVLRATPRNELKLMPKQMGYPASVREAAAKLL